MQFTPFQLKEKLLGALDEDNNVVDTAVVLEVITILEKFPITREALEQTRIGRHVNELRKKTTNEELSKRAKKLVRGWQKLLTIQDSCNVNGDSISTPPQHRNVSALQNAGNGSKPSSPANRSPAINKNCVAHVRSSLSPAVSGRPVTPTSQQRALLPNKQGKISRTSTPDPNGSKLSPGIPRNSSTSSLKALVNSPHQSVNTCAQNLQGSRLSPAVSQTFPQNVGGKNAKLQSPQLAGSVRPVTPIGIEDSSSSFPGTRSSVHSSRSLETGNGHVKSRKSKTSPGKGGKVKSDKKSNHSTDSLSQKSLIGSTSDQSSVSKTDIANRKRARLEDQSVTPIKQQKFDTHVHSLSSKQPLNGKIYSKPASDKSRHNVPNNSASLDTSRSCESPTTPMDCSTPICKRTVTRQELLKFGSAVKTPKVKTTAELITELQQKTGSANYGNNILEKLRTKQIEHESDVQTSVLPPGIRPRKKRKSSNESSLLSVPSLSQTKTELVEKFLQTSVSPTLTDFSPQSEDYSMKSESPINSSEIAEESIIDICKNCEPIHNESKHMQTSTSQSGTQPVEKRLTIEDIYSQLPPINLDIINWESQDFEVPEPQAVSDSDVFRINNENWSGINGCSDRSGIWHDWASTLTMSSFDDDPLHILPYVVVDD